MEMVVIKVSKDDVHDVKTFHDVVEEVEKRRRVALLAELRCCLPRLCPVGGGWFRVPVSAWSV
jgi:hypothetical protein